MFDVMSLRVMFMIQGELDLVKVKKTAKKRAANIFTTMPVAHVDEEVSDSQSFHVEKIFSNGDIYIGQWVSENCPHGDGKYLWSDGCMYFGEWFKGRTNGRGKFSWPSGASYEGSMSYANGDHYEGEWRKGLQDGNGTYQWNSGHQYIGQWRKGKMSGNGTMIWTNGKRYEGCWEGGFPKGNGTFRWDDGSFYVGVWGKDPKEPTKLDKIFGWFSSDQKLQRQPLRKNSKNENQGRRQSVAGRISNGEALVSQGVDNGHILGHSVGKATPTKSLGLKPTAFDAKEKYGPSFLLKDPNTLHLTSHAISNLKTIARWKLRNLFNVDPADYMLSICGSEALRELSSPGKSGSFFYMTNDDKYMIKTIKKSEVKVLKRMLPAYFEHMQSFDNTLITKFFGLHCVKLSGSSQKKVPINRRFDLKGSSHGRITDKPETEIDANTTLKDLDLNFLFRLQKDWFQEFSRQVDRDCQFLEQERIMDYSLLVGISVRESNQDLSADEGDLSGPGTPTGNTEADSSETSPRDSSADTDTSLNPTRWDPVRLGINMPARVEVTVRSHETQLVGEPTGEFYSVVLFFGIIDILQDYDISKKLEHAYKAFQYDPTSISAVDPIQYSKRFRDFIYSVFKEDS
ncbi:phosphatidylinositol 4-phosphate 5-kinase 6-like protein [Tanacetum coccineum]|uniref:1-phosphatidylinositol-4-phosphate 5-kinase n=1 Tax=Tanacetum coccineum TaxID=301880 RepID=A0ABQ5EI09_9ASTR